MVNETNILESFKEWLEEREEQQEILTKLSDLSNDYGTGWEHWLKYELAFLLSDSLDPKYEVCLEKLVDIDGRGLGGTKTKRIDLAISWDCGKSDQCIQLIELKVGWLTEKEIDDYIGNDLDFTEAAIEHYLLDMYYLNKVKEQATKCRGTFILCFFATQTDNTTDNPVDDEKVKDFLGKYKKKLGEYAGLEQRKIKSNSVYAGNSLYLAEFSISI